MSGKLETTVFEYKTVPKQPSKNQIEAAIPLLETKCNLSRQDTEALAASIYLTMVDIAPPLEFPDKLTRLQVDVWREYTRQAIGLKRSPFVGEVARGIGHEFHAVNKAFQALIRKKYIIRLSDRRRRNKYKINIAPE